MCVRASVRSSMEALWLCYSSPTPQSASHLLALFVVCLSLAAVTASLLFHWLIDLLKYDIQTALVAVGIYATAVFILSSLIHPFRCAFTLIFPTLFTRQGRKLLLSYIRDDCSVVCPTQHGRQHCNSHTCCEMCIRKTLSKPPKQLRAHQHY